MNTLIKLIGIFSEIFLISIVLICWRKEKKFDFRKDAFSYFGTNKKTKRIFNIGLAACTLLRFLFVSQIINYFKLWENIWIVSVFVLGCLVLFISAVIPWNKHEKIHNAAAKGITFTSVLFILSISLAIWKINLFLSIFNLLIFIFMTSLAIYILMTKKINGIPQIFFLGFIMLWDWVMTLKLFNII